ncbi:unnamed protein product [Rotaria sp. Silwood2]|nr:unnamed protein product [Rotaria sp. Silwood2]CAF4223884.1 unnamed protein product [Rotaria sp. Silwood2]CAF4263274.1 unnamed protein product [Rotaria sp. Silwood2]
MNMSSLNVNIFDLPDEILIIIFNKLNNVDLLYSLIGINPKLDKIVCDICFTKDINLMTISPNDTSDSRFNAMVDRFHTQILPRIHNNVESLSIQASLLQRILHSNNYPNLHKLNLEMDMAFHIFNKKSLFIRAYKHQISHLTMTLTDISCNKSTEITIGQTYVAIFSWLSNLQYLDLDSIDGNLYSRRLLSGLSPTRCYSSTVAHLRIRIHNFDDCLCLLDGRLRQLHTLIVKLDYVRYSRIIINNEVKNSTIEGKLFHFKICWSSCINIM